MPESVLNRSNVFPCSLFTPFYGARSNYTGKQWDEDAELYYFNARWYDPETARFITEDPIKDGMLWFAYCNNNPMTHIDPTGMLTIDGDGNLIAEVGGSDPNFTGSPDSDDPWGSELDDDLDLEEQRAREKEVELEALAKELEEKDVARNEARGLVDKICAIFEYTATKNDLLSAIEGYARNGGDRAKEYIQSNTEIVVTRGYYGEPGKHLWDGKMDLNFHGTTINSIRVQTWADWESEIDPNKDGTARPGSYSGQLYSETGMFNDVIRFLSPDFQTHGNQKKNESSPYSSSPFSLGCIIGKADDYFSFVDTMKDIGYFFGDETTENKGDTIDFQIELSKNHLPESQSDWSNHYIGTQGNR